MPLNHLWKICEFMHLKIRCGLMAILLCKRSWGWPCPEVQAVSRCGASDQRVSPEQRRIRIPWRVTGVMNAVVLWEPILNPNCFPCSSSIISLWVISLHPYQGDSSRTQPGSLREVLSNVTWRALAKLHFCRSAFREEYRRYMKPRHRHLLLLGLQTAHLDLGCLDSKA